ncbi:MAG: hypothetical protein AAFX03_03620 [Pseudomonadota bacterium]
MAKTSLIALAFSAAGLAAACTEPQSAETKMAEHDHEHDHDHHGATVKPGASVTFSHEAPARVAVGETGTVTITVEEAYESGSLFLQASGDDGLTVIAGGDGSARYSMALQSTHEWTVTFSAEADGVYYLNVLATAEPDDRPSASRAYAARVVVGDPAVAVAARQKNGKPGLDAGGAPVVVLEADETIEP